MKLKRDVMLFEDEPLFKKQKHFATAVLKVNIIDTCVILSYIPTFNYCNSILLLLNRLILQPN